MEIAGVELWEKVIGKSIRVKANDCGVEAIGHIVKNDWYCPATDFSTTKT